MKKNAQIFLFLFYTCLSILTAQTVPYQQYTIHDGLAQMQVECVFQDSRGYIWVGTRGGVSKFNGKTFENLLLKDGLPTPVVKKIVEDSKGNIWFGTSRGLAKYDGKKLEIFPIDSIRLVDMTIDGQDRIWVVDRKDKLLVFEKGRFEAFPTSIDDTPSRIFFNTNDQVLYISFESKGVFYLKDNNFIPLFGKVLSRDFLEGYPVSLYLVRDFGTKTEPNRYSLMRIDNLEAVEIVNGIYTDNKKVLQASNFDIYFYDKKGLYKIPTQTKTLVQIAPNVFNGILSSYKDHNGRFWVGTEEGLVQFSSDAFITYPKKKLEYTWSILEDKKGVMWFASYGHGLKKLERDSIVEVTEHLKLSPKLQKTFYMGAAKAKNGDLVFTMSAGLLKYDGQEFSVLDTNTNLI